MFPLVKSTVRLTICSRNSDKIQKPDRKKTLLMKTLNSQQIRALNIFKIKLITVSQYLIKDLMPIKCRISNLDKTLVAHLNISNSTQSSAMRNLTLMDR